MKTLHLKEFRDGMRAGMPVCVGYFSVSFGFGALAVTKGLSLWHAILISATNLTSAGQFAGLTVITAGELLITMILTQLVINSRYTLMSIALGQRFDTSVGVGPRLAMAFFNTDENFALGMTRQGKLTVSYFLGVGLVSFIGWVGGTAMGAFAGGILPQSVSTALGIMLYGMFIAIVVPQARQEKPILGCMLLALVLSCLFAWVPVLNTVSAGIAIVICTVAAAAAMALLCPVADEEVAA